MRIRLDLFSCIAQCRACTAGWHAASACRGGSEITTFGLNVGATCRPAICIQDGYESSREIGELYLFKISTGLNHGQIDVKMIFDYSGSYACQCDAGRLIVFGEFNREIYEASPNHFQLWCYGFSAVGALYSTCPCQRQPLS